MAAGQQTRPTTYQTRAIDNIQSINQLFNLYPAS